MTANKLNSLLLPLLVTILLSTLGKLKIGRTIDNVSYALLSPLQTPVTSLRYFTQNQFSFLVSLPSIYKENRELKNVNSALLSENQNLKNLIQDKADINSIKLPFQSAVPVRVISNGNQITVTTSLDTSQVEIGQPVVSGSVLIGVVSEIKKPIITINTLMDENFPGIQIKTSLGQSGTYQYSSRTPQMINIPSEDPVSLNDNVFTQAGEKIPANLVIGKITKILTSSQSPLQKAEIKLELDSTKIKDLIIITKI